MQLKPAIIEALAVNVRAETEAETRWSLLCELHLTDGLANGLHSKVLTSVLALFLRTSFRTVGCQWWVAACGLMLSYWWSSVFGNCWR